MTTNTRATTPSSRSPDRQAPAKPPPHACFAPSSTPALAPINFTPTNEAAGGRIARDNHVVFIDGATRLARRPAEVLARLSTGLPASFHGEMQNVSRPIVITTNEPDAADRLSSRILPVELPEVTRSTPQRRTQPPLRRAPQIDRRRHPASPSRSRSAVCRACRSRKKRDSPKPCNGPPPHSSMSIKKSWFASPERKTNCKPTSSKSPPKEEESGEGTATELVAALNLKLTARALSQKLAEIHPICVTKSRRKEERTIKLTLEADAKPESPEEPAKAA